MLNIGTKSIKLTFWWFFPQMSSKLYLKVSKIYQILNCMILMMMIDDWWWFSSMNTKCNKFNDIQRFYRIFPLISYKLSHKMRPLKKKIRLGVLLCHHNHRSYFIRKKEGNKEKILIVNAKINIFTRFATICNNPVQNLIMI